MNTFTGFYTSVNSVKYTGFYQFRPSRWHFVEYLTEFQSERSANKIFYETLVCLCTNPYNNVWSLLIPYWAHHLSPNFVRRRNDYFGFGPLLYWYNIICVSPHIYADSDCKVITTKILQFTWYNMMQHEYHIILKGTLRYMMQKSFNLTNESTR